MSVYLDPMLKHTVDIVVGHFHVYAPDDEVESVIRQRAAKWGVNMITMEALVRYALRTHAHNLGLYKAVAKGMF